MLYGEPVGYTCPLIDEVINQINNVISFLERNDYDDKFLNEAKTEHINDLYSSIDTMEDIRDANGQLRDWGNNMESEYEDIECDRDNLASMVDDLREQRDELQFKLTQTEDKIDELENRIMDLEYENQHLHVS